MNIGNYTALRNSYISKESVKLLVVSDAQLYVPGNDSFLFEISSSVSSKFKNFGREVLQHCSEVEWGTHANSVSILALLQ